MITSFAHFVKSDLLSAPDISFRSMPEKYAGSRDSIHRSRGCHSLRNHRHLRQRHGGGLCGYRGRCLYSAAPVDQEPDSGFVADCFLAGCSNFFNAGVKIYRLMNQSCPNCEIASLRSHDNTNKNKMFVSLRGVPRFAGRRACALKRFGAQARQSNSKDK